MQVALIGSARTQEERPDTSMNAEDATASAAEMASEKLREAIASLMAMGWSEEEARKILDDTLRDLSTKGRA